MSATQETDLTFLTKPDVIRSSLAIQRIVAIRHEDRMVHVYTGYHDTERTVCMPVAMAAQILKAAATIGQEKPGSLASYNCHRFARALYGLEDGEDHFAPLQENVEGWSEVTRLPLGAIGVHYAHSTTTQFNILHSVVGLGENQADALQVFSRGSEFGIANIADALARDQVHRSYPVRLYQITPGP